MASNPQECFFYINTKKKKKTPTLINLKCLNDKAEGEYLESICNGLVNTPWTSDELERLTANNHWKFYCWDGTSVVALHFKKNRDERLKIIRDTTPVMWQLFQLQQQPFDFGLLLNKLPINKVVESTTAAAESTELAVRLGMNGPYTLGSQQDNGNQNGVEVSSGIRVVHSRQPSMQSSRNGLRKVALKPTQRSAISPSTKKLMEEGNNENKVTYSNKPTTPLSFSPSAKINVECHAPSRLIKQVLPKSNRAASQAHASPRTPDDFFSTDTPELTSSENNQEEAISLSMPATLSSSPESNDELRDADENKYSFTQGEEPESDSFPSEKTPCKYLTETDSRRGLETPPAPVTSHFLFLCAFSELPLNKKAAVVYMLGFVMLALALGGTSLLGVGVATAATVVGYAGGSMMLAGATLIFFNESKQVPRHAQAKQDSPCCV